MKKMRGKKGTGLMAVGLLLLAAALCLTGYNVWEERQASAAAARAVQEIDRLRELRTPSGGTEQPAEEAPTGVPVPDAEMPELEIDGRAYIGTLEVPALGLSLPVMSQWSEQDLKRSPCRYVGSVYTDDLVVAGHNYRGHFKTLRELVPGDGVSFTGVDGTRFLYTVAELEQLVPTAVEEMISGDWDLTLFTCTTGGQYRVAVRCVRAEP